MKEILEDNDLGPLINDSSDSINRDIEKIEEKKNDENPFEIITDEEVKSVKKKDNELKKNLMYIMNKDENIYSDLNSVNENNASKETNNIMDELLSNSNTFTDINPLRIQETKDKLKDDTPKSKSQAIQELVSNLKTQYIIFKYDLIFSSPNISIKNYNPCFFFINSHSSIFILSISFIFSVSALNNALKNSSNFSFKSSLLI